MMQSFSSLAKSKTRQEDLALIKDLSSKAKRKLTYLGLPSPWMADVTAWKPYLAHIYAIEKEQAYLSHLMDRAYVLDVFNQFTYFYGNIDTIIKTQLDSFGQPVSSVFPIDIMNLDYCEGLDYQGFSKLATLELLIIRQKEALMSKQLSFSFPYFLIFLTHNIPLREGNPKAKLEYLKFLTREIDLFDEDLKGKVQKSFEWYISSECPSAYQHKCFVMGKLFDYAQSNGFKAIPRKIIQYLGDKNAVMMHYQFQLTPVNLQSMIPVYNKMSVIDIMNYPVTDENDSNIISNFPIIR